MTFTESDVYIGTCFFFVMIYRTKTNKKEIEEKKTTEEEKNPTLAQRDQCNSMNFTDEL